jgi:hypothetical protein
MNTLAPILTTIAAVILGIAGFAIWLFSIHWVLDPLDRAAKSRRCPNQFNLGDLLSLFILTQLALGCVQWVFYDYKSVFGIYLFAILASLAAWWLCVLTLSRAGIHTMWRRCVVIGAVIPAAFAGSIAVAAIPCCTLLCFHWNKTNIGVLLLLLEPVIFGVLYLLARMVRRSVKLAETAETSNSNF